MSDGHTVFEGKDNSQISSPPKYDTLIIADKSNGEQFISDLKAHQQGKTN